MPFEGYFTSQLEQEAGKRSTPPVGAGTVIAVSDSVSASSRAFGKGLKQQKDKNIASAFCSTDMKRCTQNKKKVTAGASDLDQILEDSNLIEQEKKGLDKGQQSEFTMSEPSQSSIRIIEPPDRVGIGALGLSYTDTPETGEVPAVDGFINGKPARIMLDSGCGTYALSYRFVTKHNVEAKPTPPIPLDLAETTDKANEI